jgi:hypothetical protein
LRLNVCKEASRFDLDIAIGMLAANDPSMAERLDDDEFQRVRASVRTLDIFRGRAEGRNARLQSAIALLGSGFPSVGLNIAVA